MKKKLTLTLFGFIAFISLYSQVDSKIAQIDNMVNHFTNYYGFCGTVLVENDGEIILNKGYGYASYELNIPVSDSTKFNIASITKWFTRVLIDKLIKEGKLNLNDKLIKYLPEIGEEKGNKILIKHLVTHQSGLKEKYFEPVTRSTNLDRIKSNKDLPMNFEPGIKHEYCNFNYFILGIIIERLTGNDLASAYKENIFKPFELNSAQLDNVENMIKNMAVPHYVNQVNQPDLFIHVYPKSNSRGSAAGGIIINSEDLLKWIHILHSDKLDLKLEKIDKEFPNIYNNVYGNFSTGWEKDGVGRRYVQADGMGEGFRALYIYLPDDGITVILLNNSYFFPAEYITTWNYLLFDEIVYNSVKIILEMDYKLPKLPVGQILINDLEESPDVDELVSKYINLKDKEDEYLFDVKQLNRLAYALMEKDRMTDALKILNLNITEYPEHWIAVDGMAEYFLRTGDKENAIKYLKISIETNPNKWREQRKMNDIRRNNLETINWKE